MKLLSCYIENFGNIRQRSFTFDKGLTSLCEHNGYGKTTLAAFLKAMFYGLKQTTARDKELGERAHYYPFDGGKFGGNVVFEKGGTIYKIERFFGRKSATEDTVAMYRGGNSVPVPEDAGKEFFGLDEQSFLRTVFLNSADTEAGATGDISRMLNGFVDDADFEGAKKRLEEKQKEYKKRGGGAIAETHAKILRLRSEIENKEKIFAELAEKYRARAELAKEIAGLEERQSSARDKNLILQKWQTYDGFLSDAAAEREKLGKISEKYPSGLPDAGEAQELKKSADALNLANERLISAAFSAEKERKLSELSARFSGGVPTDEELAAANDGATEIIRLEAEIANCENLIKAGAANKFPAGIPDEEEVDKYGEKLRALRAKRQRAETPAAKKLPLILALVSVVLLGAGVGLLFWQTVVGGVVLALGAVCLLAAIFFYFKIQINAMKAAPDSGEDNDIRCFLARYGCYSDGGTEVDFNNLLRDMEEYNAGTAERDRNVRLLIEKRAQADGAKVRVISFLNRYNFGGENMQADLTRLGVLAAEYSALNAEKAEFAAREAASGAEIENRKRCANEILYKYSISPGGNLGGLASEILLDRNEFDRLNENLQRLEKRAENYRTENGLGERPSETEEDVRGIDAALSAKREELSLSDRDISDDETSVERLAELKEELETVQRQEREFTEKYNLLEKTLSFLQRAEQNLKDRYISPVKNSFISYGNLLEKALGEKVAFDTDFKVKFERGGELREDGHLSAGQKSLCALCLRLALIDNMYRDEKPFIIMDDPFVHLDKEHMQRAEVLLRELAKNKQIIYFCCHESRKI